MSVQQRPFPGPSGSSAANTPSDGDIEQASADKRQGLIAALAAYTTWGLLPSFITLLDRASPYEVVIHRVLWAVPFCMLIITVRRQWAETGRALRDKKTLSALLVSSIFIAANWLVFIIAVANDLILETSLGYYINPLMIIAAGVLLLGERLTKFQAIALALATIGVFILVLSTKVIPWTALILAVTFTVYALQRKRINIGAVPGLFIETLTLLPFALTALFLFVPKDTLTFAKEGIVFSTLLALTGPVTVIPLTLFAFAARRISLTTIGFMQYIAPTMSMLTALLFGEQFTLAHGICFGMIWTAIGLISVEAINQQRRAKVRP